MAVDKVKKLASDVLCINNGLQEVSERINNIIQNESFGTIDTTILGDTNITTIDIGGTGLKGKIPNGAVFTLTHEDGSFPLYIQNLKDDLEIGDTTITIYVDGNQPGDQVKNSGFGYPKGSLVSSPGYAGNDSFFAAGDADEVQFNTNGQLSTDPNFKFDVVAQKLTTPNIEVSGVIDGDIYASDGTNKVLENGTDGTDATFTGDVTGDLTGTADIADKVKVTSSTASTNKYIPFVTNTNDADANLLTNTSLKYQPNIGKLSATRVDATKFVGDVYASNSSSKILDNGTTGADATIVANVNNVQGTIILDISAGQLNAAVVGDVTGSVTGDVTGDLTGNVTGDVTGDLTGNVTGDVTGDLTGSVTGDVTGDLTGNVTGDVTGDLTGSVTGDVTGDLTGSVTGDVTGDVTGNVSGSSGSCTGNSATATKIASITNANIVQLTDTQTLTNKTLTSPTLTTPALGTPSSGDLTNCTFPTLDQDTTGNAATATKIASITNANIVQLTDTQTLTNKTLTDCEANTQAVGDNSTKLATTAFVLANAGTGGGTPAGSNTFVQYNNNGSFGADFGMAYNNTTYSLNVAGTVDATFLDGNLTATSILVDGVTATLQPLNDSSSKVATCSFVQQEITDAAVTPGGVSHSIQTKSINGNFSGTSLFKFNVDQTGGNLYMNGRATFGDGNNGATGIYAFAIGTNTNATSQDAFALGENALASGRQSIAGGYECLAQGSASFAIGALTSSYGERSASFGSNSDNFGEDSVVMGHNHGVATTSDRSLTLGYENTNNSSNSLLMGQSNTLLNLYAGGTSGGGTGCLVGGYNNSVQVNDGIVFGSDCDAGVTSAGSNNSKNQFLFGLGLGVPKNNAGDAAGQAQIVVGKYNESQNQIHTVFSVGTGADAANRKTSFVVESQGRVAVGKTAPNLLFEVNGSAGKPGGGSWSTISDERVKTNIRPYNKGLSDIIKLDPKIYDYNGKAAMPIDIKDNVGVIAQEIKDVFPDTVESYETKLNETDEDKVELLSFNPNELTYALINSVKELNAEVQALKKELNELKNK